MVLSSHFSLQYFFFFFFLAISNFSEILGQALHTILNSLGSDLVL